MDMAKISTRVSCVAELNWVLNDPSNLDDHKNMTVNSEELKEVKESPKESTGTIQAKTAIASSEYTTTLLEEMIVREDRDRVPINSMYYFRRKRGKISH